MSFHIPNEIRGRLECIIQKLLVNRLSVGPGQSGRRKLRGR
jgi:hypothetical protein